MRLCTLERNQYNPTYRRTRNQAARFQGKEIIKPLKFNLLQDYTSPPGNGTISAGTHTATRLHPDNEQASPFLSKVAALEGISLFSPALPLAQFMVAPCQDCRSIMLL
jgi:hypothetical protein